jgi:hypothetical protein
MHLNQGTVLEFFSAALLVDVFAAEDAGTVFRVVGWYL